MQKSNFDVFISYRRATGSLMASRINDNLLLRGYTPFYDITEMRAGRFDEQLKNRLIGATNFVLILSKNALDRCKDEGDWVKQEIMFAISHHKNIIIVQEDQFEYPSPLPEDLKDLPLYQTIVYNDDKFYQTMEEICRLFIQKKDEFYYTLPTTAINKKINLTGEYITIYEDIEDGKRIVQKAPAKISQHWNKITGETYFSANQAWVLNGLVDSRKRIAGMYQAKDILDEGFGTFFLEIKSNDILDGFWSGYDNVNHTVTSGRYLFKRKKSNLIIKPIEKKFIPEICKIADAQLGVDYITENQLVDCMTDEQSFCLCALDKDTSHVVGFCLSAFIEREEAIAITGKDILELKYADHIGYLKTLAVSPQAVGYGIGSQLVQECLTIFKRKKVDIILSTAWKHAGIINIGGVLDRHGFEKRKEIEDYWYESSLKEDFQCPQCGKPCHCTCVIYIKDMDK